MPRASRVGLSLNTTSGSIVLRIQDDGTGFETQITQASDHFGLTGMRERAALAGGLLDVDSKQGTGTTLTLTLVGAF